MSGFQGAGGLEEASGMPSGTLKFLSSFFAINQRCMQFIRNPCLQNKCHALFVVSKWSQQTWRMSHADVESFVSLVVEQT